MRPRSGPRPEGVPVRAQVPGPPRGRPVPRRGAAPGRGPGCTARVLWFLAGLLGGALAVVALPLLLALLFPPPHTNILLLGLDHRPGESTVSRTDTMILVGLDPAAPSVAMLSIPRDLWVQVPGIGEQRINTAHFFAESEQAGSGPAAAMRTVEANSGVAVRRYVRIDFEGFVRIVDAAGGIEVDAPARLVDYEYPTDDYGVTTVIIEAGRQQMDGATALAYARIRHGSSDFKRAERQQQVIEALLAQLLNPAALPRYPAVLRAVRSSLQTNVSPLLALRLAPTVLRVGPAGIHRQVIEGEMVRATTTGGGASVQVPVWEAINPVLRQYFGK